MTTVTIYPTEVGGIAVEYPFKHDGRPFRTVYDGERWHYQQRVGRMWLGSADLCRLGEWMEDGGRRLKLRTEDGRLLRLRKKRGR